MKRNALAREEGERKKFRATFSRYGKKVSFKGYTEETVLLVNIINLQTQEPVADHIWFSLTKGFETANLKEGTVIEFNARIKEYNKGYVNRKLGINKRRSDYKLSHPTNIKVVG